jgi:hypothetical protein
MGEDERNQCMGELRRGSWCLLYRVKVRRGEAVRCRQMVTDGGGSSRRPFRLGRGNERGAADLMGEEERSRRHFVSPTHERGRATDSELWHVGAPGEAAAIPSDQGGRKAPGWAGDGPRMGCELGRRGNFQGKF